MSDDREHDLVLVGATGFVGRLTAQHLAVSAPVGLRVALAGRSSERLEALRDTLPALARAWPLVVVDVSDPAAVAALARSTRVVVTTVGPYLRHGLPLVEACAQAGTDYADLTGETLFVRRSLDAAHARAQQTGARIVHSCGFDSVPSDLGVGLAAARARTDGAGLLGETVLHVRSARGGVSGGTVDSLRQQAIEAAGDPEVRRLIGRSGALVDDPAPRRRTARRAGAVSRDVDTGRWQAPFLMGPYNGQVVHRSNALTGGSYGPDFGYREVVDTGRGPGGALAAALVTAGSAALTAGMFFGPTRSVLDRLLPDPGAGPSEQTLRRGRFRFEVVAETTTGVRYVTTVATERDPGYYGTAVMLGESGLALALDDLPSVAGVLTPMVALGEALAVRLREHAFEVQTRRAD